MLLETKVDIAQSEVLHAREHSFREVERITDSTRLHALSADLGETVGRVLVIEYVWKEFMAQIGGFQYVRDLAGQQKIFYDETQSTVFALMKKRRELIAAVKSECQKQMDVLLNNAVNNYAELFSADWDQPSEMEVTTEAGEDRLCAERQADN